MGRPRLSPEDMIFSAAFKVYSTVSGRRFMSDLPDAHAEGFISRLPCYNSIFNYFEDEALTPYLQILIEQSSLPLTAIESDFAVDSSSFSTCRFFQWVDAKYTNPTLINKREWVKVHLMCGVKTNVVTLLWKSATALRQIARSSNRWSIRVHEFHYAGSLRRQGLLVGGQPANSDRPCGNAVYSVQIKQRSRSPEHRPDLAARRMYHYYSYNQRWFLQQYHKRSNVESTFSMIKAKFGDGLWSRTKTAQVNVLGRGTARRG